MATNVRRNSTNVPTSINIPTVTIVDSVEPKRRSCCGCIPESVGVFAILSVYFFLGIFCAAASFVGLSFNDNVAERALSSISGCLYTFLAISSGLSVTAIRKEKIVMMRRLSITFWILTALTFILSVITFILQVIFKPGAIDDCNQAVTEIYGPDGNSNVDCNSYVNYTLISEAIKLIIVEAISIYFTYVIHRYTKRMVKSPLPSIAPFDGQKTPTYVVYNAHPPTSRDWTPPPVYTVRPTNPLPADFDPDSKQAPPPGY